MNPESLPPVSPSPREENQPQTGKIVPLFLLQSQFPVLSLAVIRSYWERQVG